MFDSPPPRRGRVIKSIFSTPPRVACGAGTPLQPASAARRGVKTVLCTGPRRVRASRRALGPSPVMRGARPESFGHGPLDAASREKRFDHPSAARRRSSDGFDRLPALDSPSSNGPSRRSTSMSGRSVPSDLLVAPRRWRLDGFLPGRAGIVTASERPVVRTSRRRGATPPRHRRAGRRPHPRAPAPPPASCGSAEASGTPLRRPRRRRPARCR